MAIITLCRNKMVKFKCRECGRCCGGFPGYVWLSKDDIKKIANFLQLTEKIFIIRYTRVAHGKISLTECRTNYDCIFLKDKKCQIYAVRPEQCRTFPFWSDTKQWWDEACKNCPGIDLSS